MDTILCSNRYDTRFIVATRANVRATLIGDVWNKACMRKASCFTVGPGNLGQTSDKNDNTVVRIAIIWALAACQSSLSQLSVRYTVGRAGINGG